MDRNGVFCYQKSVVVLEGRLVFDQLFALFAVIFVWISPRLTLIHSFFAYAVKTGVRSYFA